MAKQAAAPKRVLALGATSAIAEATLRLLAEQHATFFLVGRNPQKLAAVRDDLLTRGAASAATCIADLDDTDAHPAMLAVISSVAGDRGRKSNYVYGASKGGLNVFLDGVRNRIDRAGVQVLTIKPGFVATPMTAHLPKNALFAEPAQVARHILRAIEKRKDVAYVPPFWGLIMLIVRNIPRRIFKKMNM